MLLGERIPLWLSHHTQCSQATALSLCQCILLLEVYKIIGCFHSVDFSLYTLYGVPIEGKQEPMVLLQAAELSHAQSSMYLLPIMDVRRLHRTLFSPSRSLTSSFKRVLTRLPPTTSPMPIGFYWTPFDVISM